MCVCVCVCVCVADMCTTVSVLAEYRCIHASMMCWWYLQVSLKLYGGCSGKQEQASHLNHLSDVTRVSENLDFFHGYGKVARPHRTTRPARQDACAPVGRQDGIVSWKLIRGWELVKLCRAAMQVGVGAWMVGGWPARVAGVGWGLP